MDLLVIRHAIAGDRDEWARSGRPDAERPITKEGRIRMAENARAIAGLVPDLDLIATSPYIRAAQTADVVAETYGGLEVVEVDALRSGGPREEIAEWLSGRGEARIAVVGHEPDLGELVSWFVFGHPEPAIPLKKGGACLLRFAGPPEPGAAELRWLLPPRVMRRMGA